MAPLEELENESVRYTGLKGVIFNAGLYTSGDFGTIGRIDRRQVCYASRQQERKIYIQTEANARVLFSLTCN